MITKEKMWVAACFAVLGLALLMVTAVDPRGGLAYHLSNPP